MAYDVALHPSGDWLFGPSRDIQGVTGPELDRQRIIVRCKIPRGSFVYDADDSLGSRLHEVTRFPGGGDLSAVRAYVTEALEGMEGIVLNNVAVEQDGKGINVNVEFVHMPDADESDFGASQVDDDENVGDPPTEFSFQI